MADGTVDRLQIEISADANSASDSLSKLEKRLEGLKKSLSGINSPNLGELSNESKKTISDFNKISDSVSQLEKNLASLFSEAGPKWDISALEDLGSAKLTKGIAQLESKLNTLAGREEQLKLIGRDSGAGWEGVQYRISAALNQLIAYQEALKNISNKSIDIPIELNIPDDSEEVETPKTSQVSADSLGYDPSAMAAVFPEFAGIKDYNDAVQQLGSQAGLVMNGLADPAQKITENFSQASQSVDELKSNLSSIDVTVADRLKDALDSIEDSGAVESLNQIKNRIEEIKQSISGIDVGDMVRRFADVSSMLSSIQSKVLAMGQSISHIDIPANITTGLGKIQPALKGISGTASKAKSVFSEISDTVKNFGARLSGAVKKIKDMGQAINRTGKNASGNDFGFGNAVGMSLVFSAVYGALGAIESAISEGSGNLAQYSSDFNNSISSMMSGLTQLKNAFAAAFSPIVQIVSPAITTFINLMSRAVNLVGAFFSALTGKSMAIQAVSVTEDYAASVAGVGDAAEASKKKVSNLMGIDELNVINQEEPASSGGGSAGGEVPATDMFETVPINSGVLEAAQQLKDILSGVFQPFKNAWDTMGATVIQSAKTALQNMGSLAQSVGQSLYDVWTNGSGETALSTMFSIVSNIFDIVGGLAERFQIAWDTAGIGTSIVQSIFDIFNSVLSIIDRITEQTAIWVQSLDFTPLLSSVSTLLEALAPFTDTVGKGLEWLWTNVLLPIAGWTLQEAVPAFLDMLASGVSALNTLLTTFQPLGEWLWNNFLQPIGEWTGNVIIEALGLVTEQLQKFSSWLEQNNGIEDFVGVLDSVKENITDVATQIGDALTPAAQFMGEKVIPDVLQAFKDLSNLLTPLGEFLSDMFLSIWQDMLQPAFEYVGETVIPLVTETFENLWNNVLVPFGQFLESILRPAVDLISQVFTILWKTVVVPLAEFLGSVFSSTFEAIVTIFNETVVPAVNGVITIFQFLWNNVFSPIASFLVSTFGPVFEQVFEAIGELISDLEKAFSGLIDFITGVFTGNWESAWNGIKTFLSSIWDAMKTIVNTTFSAIQTLVSNILSGIKSGWETVWNGIKDFASNIWGTIKNTASTIFGEIRDTLSEIWDSVKSTIEEKWTEIKDWFSETWEAIKGFFKVDEFVDIGKNVLNNLWEGMKSIWEALSGWVSGIASDIASFFSGIISDAEEAINASKEAEEAVSESEEKSSKRGGATNVIRMNGYASGGFPRSGQVFVAREDGVPEMVGSWGGKSAVANNAQIVAGISSGVYNAIKSAASGLSLKLNVDTSNIQPVRFAGLPYAYGESYLGSGYSDQYSARQDAVGSDFKSVMRDIIREELLPVMQAANNSRDELLEEIASKDTSIYMDGRRVNQMLDKQRARSGHVLRRQY